MKKIYLEKDMFSQGEEVYAFFDQVTSVRNMHAHDFWELAYIFEGEGVNETPASSAAVRVGDFLFIKPGAEHAILCPDGIGMPARICNCLIRSSTMKKAIAQIEACAGLQGYTLLDMLNDEPSFCIRLHDDNACNIQHLVWLITHEYNHFTSGSETVIHHSLYSLLVCIIRLYEYQVRQASTPVVGRNDIDQLIKYINANFGQPLKLTMLAERIHLSPEYLSRAFHKLTGKTVSAYIAEVRVTKAKEMLRGRRFSIEYIGEYCGYRSASSFQKAFKQAVGLSPSQYRRIHRADT